MFATRCLRQHAKAVIAELDTCYAIPASQRSQALREQFEKNFKRLSARDSEDVVTYLRASRLHKELVERYNPASNMTQEERARAAARRVGLNVPVEYADPAKGGSS